MNEIFTTLRLEIIETLVLIFAMISIKLATTKAIKRILSSLEFDLQRKRISQKIFTDVPNTNKFKSIKLKNAKQEVLYAEYEKKSQGSSNKVPNVKGMAGMDAVSLLENLGLKVKFIGVGKVKKQSLNPGEVFKKNQTITIELS